MRLLLAVLWLILAAFPAAAATSGNRQTFQHWLGECRSDGYCSATGLVNPNAAGTVGDYELKLGREAQQTYWQISFTAVAATADGSRPFTAKVGGQTITFAPPDAVAPFGSGNDFFFLGKDAQRLMDRLPHEASATFGFTDIAGAPHAATFSLAGLSAALIWIDTAQHRLGSERVAEVPPFGLPRIAVTQTTAMAAPLAPAPETAPETAAGPDAPPIPLPPRPGPVELATPQPAPQTDVLAPGLPPVLLSAIDADTACAVRDPPLDAIETMPLRSGYTLYLVPCLTGAANKIQRVYVGYGDHFERAAFPEVTPEGQWSASSLVFNASFDPATLALTSTYHSLGNCGTSGTWLWSSDTSYTGWSFTLQLFRMQEKCDIEPGEMPITYQARQ